MKAILFTWKYILYFFSAKTRYDIHSPFVFGLVSRVIHDKSDKPVFHQIEGIRKKLARDHSRIEVRDFGAGFSGKKFKSLSIGFITKNSSKTAKYGRLLHRLTAFLKPSTMLELGTSVGLSTMYQATGAPAARMVTMEGCPNTGAIATRNFTELGLTNIELINGDFETTLPEFLAQSPVLEFVFIDGNHRKEAVLYYFNLCLEKSGSQTCLVIDDIYWSPGMQEAWLQIKENPRVSVTIDLFMMGIVFLNPELSKEDFIIRF